MIVIKLRGVKGDCKIPKYKEYLTVNTVSWDMDNETPDPDARGNVNIDLDKLPGVTVNKSMDIASCDLMQCAMARRPLGTADIKFLMQQGTDKDPLPYLEFKLDHAVLRSWSIEGSDDGRPTETVVINYYKIWMQYTPFDGARPGTPISRGWDRVRNEPWNG